MHTTLLGRRGRRGGGGKGKTESGSAVGWKRGKPCGTRISLAGEKKKMGGFSIGDGVRHG